MGATTTRATPGSVGCRLYRTRAPRRYRTCPRTRPAPLAIAPAPKGEARARGGQRWSGAAARVRRR
eukprot:817640-Prymnesium_polylepis.1